MGRVKIHEYDSNWVIQYETEAERIKDVIELVDIHHVGSTAVPGLVAKSKIDIIAVVRDLDFDHKGLELLGYQYRGGFSIPLRKSFTYRSDDSNVNLHVFEKGDPEIELNLLFRDYLIEHEAVREEYANLKRQLVEEESSHVKNGLMYRGYTLGKQVLIHRIMKDIGFNQYRLLMCVHPDEFKEVKSLFGIEVSVNDEGISHFVLYKGIGIVAYASVRVLDKKVNIEQMVTKESSKEHQEVMKRLVDKWTHLIKKGAL